MQNYRTHLLAVLFITSNIVLPQVAHTIPKSFDMIVAIANGGIIPAALLNQHLQIELQIIKINWSDPQQKPKYDVPQLLMLIDFDYKDKIILMVEDRAKTGATLRFAKKLLEQQAAMVKLLQ